jgi:hypothetical protein
VRVELQENKHRLESGESSHQEEIDEIRAKHSKELTKLREELEQQSEGGQPQASKAQEEKWLQERAQMLSQMQILTQSLDQQKKVQESLLMAFNQQAQAQNLRADQPTQNPQAQKEFDELERKIDHLKQKNEELFNMNSNLTQQICQMQQKQGALEDEVRTLKKFKKLVNNCAALQCKICMGSVPKEHFQDHIKHCTEEQDRNRLSTLLPTSGYSSGAHNQPQVFDAAPSGKGAPPRLHTALGANPSSQTNVSQLLDRPPRQYPFEHQDSISAS